MTDERLQQLIHEAKHGYRVPAEAPLDAMWARIEREHFDAAGGDRTLAPRLTELPARPAGRWKWAGAVGIAATLLLGVGIGRFTAPTAPPPVPPVADAAADRRAADRRAPDPLQRATSEYLDETVTLLASLPRDPRTNQLVGDARFVANAAQLLGTTRLLLDSPAASDPRMRGLLEDLELVLAQVARLRAAPRADELTFIAEAMDERDVVPRLRTVAASLSGY